MVIIVVLVLIEKNKKKQNRGPFELITVRRRSKSRARGGSGGRSRSGGDEREGVVFYFSEFFFCFGGGILDSGKNRTWVVLNLASSFRYLAFLLWVLRIVAEAGDYLYDFVIILLLFSNTFFLGEMLDFCPSYRFLV